MSLKSIATFFNCHASESWHPVILYKRWMPAFAGMTHLIIFLLLNFISSPIFADQLIIEPDMGRAPIESAINHSRQSLNLVMYGFTDKELLDALIQQKNYGRTLKIILERSPYKSESENQKTIQILDSNHIDWQGKIAPFRLIHQKTLIIDGHQAIVMTFNFTNSTFKRQRNFGLIIDDPQKVREIQSVFAADWNHKPANHSTMDLLYSPEDSRDKLITLIANARRSIKIYAQSISDYKIVGALAKAAQSGVEVNILTSSSLHSKQATYLMKAGAILRQSKHYYIHAKVFILDNQKAVIGSINLTRASLDDNRELGVLTYDSKIVKQLSSTFNNDWNESDAVGSTNEITNNRIENNETTRLLRKLTLTALRHSERYARKLLNQH